MISPSSDRPLTFSFCFFLLLFGPMFTALQLTEQLISRPSVTPDDADCQQLIAAHLAPLGFVCETIVSGPAHFSVTNL